MKPDRSFTAGLLIGIGAAVAVGAARPPTAPEPRRPVAVTLHRFDLKPGSEATFAEWIGFLHGHHRESVATLARERTYFEAMFTAPDEPRRLYWIEAQSAGGASVEPVRPPLAYADWLARAFSHRDMPLDPPADLARNRSYYTPALYDALARQTDVVAERITYESDGLRIAGFVVRPRTAPGRLPVILWCPGGDGTVLLDSLLIMSNWARARYLVIATSYRGGPQSEGHDEIGGADVDDVLALLPLARSLPGADPDRLFLYGQSRGGMEAYRAMAAGLPVRAAAVNSGVTDMSRSERPDAADLDAMNRAAMPDYSAEAANHFCRRSAICWPEKLRAPLLLLHGTADWRVPASQALDLAGRLQALRRPYTLHVVEGGAHVWLDQDQAAIDREVLAFFHAHDGA